MADAIEVVSLFDGGRGHRHSVESRWYSVCRFALEICPTDHCDSLCVCPGTSGRDLATHDGAPPAEVAAARVLPDLPGRIFTGRFTLGIASPEARAVLAIAPTPAEAAKLSVSRIAAALRRAGRSRGIDQAAAEIKAGLRKPQLRQPLLVETAMGKHALALLAALDTACANVDELGQASAELFQKHPDYAIFTSFPGLADSTGARLLAEIGDDGSRFADPRALKAYAGCAPISRASGRSISITRRHIKNNRLANVGWMWAFTAASNYDHAREHYRQRREHGDRHAAATRHLFNKLLGQLHHCLQHQQTFDGDKAFPSHLCAAAAA